MILLEHVAKQLLARHDIPVPAGSLVESPADLSSVSYPAMFKSQVPVGGRGKLGGIQKVDDTERAEHIFSELMSLEIKGYRPDTILAETPLVIEHEYYLALRINRDARRAELVVSREGGIDIENAATPPTIVPLDAPHMIETAARVLQLDIDELAPLIKRLRACFEQTDCLLLEINPLVRTNDNRLICADAKIEIDDNARFRQPDLPWNNTSHNLKLLDEQGTIGCLANGAGMAMATMDAIEAAGGRAANFLDIGGGTGEDVFTSYLQTINQLPHVRAIIINIFAGITRCDDIARGIIAARGRIDGLVPLFVRLEGTNRDLAVDLLDAADIAIEPDLATCIQKALAAVETHR